MHSSRPGCSTTSFRRQSLPEALRAARVAGFGEIELGALPGVCNHMSSVLDAEGVGRVVAAGADALALACGALGHDPARSLDRAGHSGHRSLEPGTWRTRADPRP